MSREAKVLVAILVVIVGGMIALFTLTGSNSPTPSTGATVDASKLVHPDSHKTGSGPVTVVEFGDYQCPACGQAYPITKRLLNDYKGKITLVFRNFPLSIHANAVAAASAAEAAGKQGKFWEMHDKLYDNQNSWAESTNVGDIFAGYAQDLGLNVDQFKQDEAGSAVSSIINADKSDGNTLNIQGTPTFYINGQQATDYDYNTLKSLIDSSLKH